MRTKRGAKLFVAGLAVALIVLGVGPAAASSANISHAYHTVTSITNGSIVGLDPSRSDYVQPANTTNGAHLVGVAVGRNDSLLSVDPTATTTQVATSGTVTTLVSTLNGNIKVGDKIAVSPFSGVGMKSMSGSYVIGLAQTALNNGSQGSTTKTITNKNGKAVEVKVGYISLNIAISIDNTSTGQESLNGLQDLAKSLTGHTVSTIRVAISLVIALMALIALVTLIYASIYGSIISVGRNPLAEYAIFRTLTSVLSLAVLTTAVASLTIFFLLR